MKAARTTGWIVPKKQRRFAVSSKPHAPRRTQPSRGLAGRCLRSSAAARQRTLRELWGPNTMIIQSGPIDRSCRSRPAHAGPEPGPRTSDSPQPLLEVSGPGDGGGGSPGTARIVSPFSSSHASLLYGPLISSDLILARNSSRRITVGLLDTQSLLNMLLSLTRSPFGRIGLAMSTPEQPQFGNDGCGPTGHNGARDHRQSGGPLHQSVADVHDHIVELPPFDSLMDGIDINSSSEGSIGPPPNDSLMDDVSEG